MMNLQPFVLIMAFLFDLSIGDPRWLPHPVRIIGKSVMKTEGMLRAKKRGTRTEERIKGLLLVIIIVPLSFVITGLIVYLISRIGKISYLLHLIGAVLLIYLTSTTIALRELIDSAENVIDAIRNRKIDLARKNLSMIVGRDTEDLSEKKILMATIETVSENLSDGIIAPLFYLAIGGLPLAMAYKAINTLDSMVGYKNEKYINFGWASARLDDIANYVPARLSGILIIISTFFVMIFKSPSHALRIAHNALRIMINDGRKHLSPNAGIPEAAMAGALGVRLGGPSRYNGIEVQKPYIGQEIREDYLGASQEALRITQVASIIAVCITGVFLYAK